MNVQFQQAQEKDLPAIASIYNYYVLNSTATFHLNTIPENEIAEMISLGHKKYQSFIIEYQTKTVGFCYLSPYRRKAAYNISAEITLYIHPDYTNMKIGKSVLIYLENIALNHQIKNLIAVITANNKNSIKLFESFNYCKCGHLKKIGKKFGKLLDVVSYQKEL